MAKERISPDKALTFRRQVGELARRLAIQQGHYPAEGPRLQHTMEPDAEGCPQAPPTSEANG